MHLINIPRGTHIVSVHSERVTIVRKGKEPKQTTIVGHEVPIDEQSEHVMAEVAKSESLVVFVASKYGF